MSQRREILQTVVRRIANEETPRTFSDGKEIVLLGEPGGMSGVIEGGAGTALYEIQLSIQAQQEAPGNKEAAASIFESARFNHLQTEDEYKVKLSFMNEIVAGSAGTWGISYLSQPISGTMIFVENMASHDFINPKRGFAYALHEKCGIGSETVPMMNLGALRNVVEGGVDSEKKLKTERLLNSEAPIRFAVTNLDEMRRELIDPCASGTAKGYLDAACASSLIPGVAGKPMTLSPNGPRYVDAMTSPVDFLFKDDDYRDADYVVVLSSRPLNGTRQKAFDPQAWIISQFARLAVHDRAEAKKLLDFVKNERVLSQKKVIESEKQTDRFLYLGMPEGTKAVSSACIKPLTLRNAAILAYLQTWEIFDKPLRDEGYKIRPSAPPPRWKPAAAVC